LRTRIDPALVKAIARAHAWAKMLMTGEVTSVDELAERANQHRGYVREVLRLAFLSPDITRSILEGGQRQDLTLAALLETDIPLSWSKQASVFA
jgi:site-specific DNA recombinase